MKTTFDPGTSIPVITARGIIRAVNTSEAETTLFEEVITFLRTWKVNPTDRVVDISTTASGNALPRFYRNVPWSSINSILGTIQTPVVGDSVMLGFTGGSSEFPHILGHFPGKASSAAAQTAVAPAPATPSQIQAAAFKQPLGSALADIMNIAGGFQSVSLLKNPLTAPTPSLYSDVLGSAFNSAAPILPDSRFAIGKTVQFGGNLEIPRVNGIDVNGINGPVTIPFP